MKDPKLIKALMVVVFAALVLWLLFMAYKKPLWTDELYSQLSSIKGQSYGGMLAGKIGEGNVTPLFYMTQKAWEDLGHYQTPEPWIKGQWGYQHPFSHVFLRVGPALCMAGGIAAIFYYFSSRFGVLLGVYSLLVSLSSFMVWAYGPEARPYALWFFLTTIQFLCFLNSFDEQRKGRGPWRILVLVHCLLALTVVYSIIQITAVSVLLWLLRDRDWRRYIWLWFVPAMGVLFYYLHSPHYQFYFIEGFMGLIGASFPKDRLFICGIFALYWILSWGRSRGWALPAWFKGMEPSALRWTGVYGALAVLVLAGYLGVLMIFKLQETHTGIFQISNRYFICLAPLGIIATTLFSYYLVQTQKGPARVPILAGLGLFLLWRMARTIALVGTLHIF